MAEPASIDLVVYRGLGLVEDWLFEDDLGAAVDFTGYAGQMDVRSEPGAAAVLRLNDADGSITFPGNGLVRLRATMPAGTETGTYRHDLILTPSGGIPFPWATGQVTVVDPITDVP